MPPRSKARARKIACEVPSDMQCELPLCGCAALPPLRCGHKFCQECLLRTVKMSHPEFAMLLFVCPLCRTKSFVGEGTFAIIMKQQKPKGAMIMDFADTSAGFCLAMQRTRLRVNDVPPVDFFFMQIRHYLKYLDGLGSEDWNMNTLFAELSRRCQTRMEARWLLADMPFEAPPFKLMMSELDALALGDAVRSATEREAAEENVTTI